MKKTLAVLALLALLCGPAFADSWMPFRDKRVVSPSGRFYAVVRGGKGGVSYELVERRDGAPAMKGAVAADSYGIRKGSGGSIDRDPEDTVVVTGSVPQLPMDVRVLEGGRGIVFFEKYARIGYGDVVTFVDAKGRIAFRHALRALFDQPTRSSFTRSVSSIWWYSGFAVSEARNLVLIVAAEDRLVTVSLEDGEVATPAPEALIPGFREGTPEERILFLETAARLKPKGMLPEALAIAGDATETVSIRLRAAVAVKRAGGSARFDPLFLTGVAKGNPPDVRKYATAHLGEVLGKGAIPIMRDLMRGPADNDVWHPAQEGFVSLGEAAVPTLCEMVVEKDQSPDYRGGAAHALAKIGSKQAIDALLTATAEPRDAYTANAAVNAAIAIGAPDLGRRLAKILEAGSTQDGRIAMYFESNPADYARNPLKAALKRAAPDSFAARRIQAALTALD